MFLNNVHHAKTQDIVTTVLLFTGDIPRGVFCEWSKAEVTENPGWGAPKCDYGAFCVHHVTMSGLWY